MKSQRHLTIVIKLGTSSIVDERTHEPLLSILSLIVETAVKLRKDGHRVVIVSSGAIGVGLRRMDVDKRPKILSQVQALAAIGQCRLISLWDSLFAHLRQPIAQILLTRNDIADRTQYLNAQNTFTALLSMGVIPIVNENDTLAVTEIKFGDNDTLSAITAAMVSADYLFLMTDVDCLYTANPRNDPTAQPIPIVPRISDLKADTASAGSALGTGGMGTKIVAARLATSAGITVVITKSSKPGNIRAIVEYLEAKDVPEKQTTTNITSSEAPPLHTCFVPSSSPIKDRRFWLLHGLAPHGTIYIDEGAYKALGSRAGLLPVGVVEVDGHFAQQEAVRIVVVRAIPKTSRPISILDARSPLRQEFNNERPNRASTPDWEDSATPSVPGTPAAALNLGGLGGYETASEFDFSTDATTVMSSSTHSLVSTDHPQPTLADLIDPSVPPKEVGRALVNYSSMEISRIKGLRSSQIEKILGYADTEYVAFRENVSLTTMPETQVHSRTTSSTSTMQPSTQSENVKVGSLASFG